MSFLTQLKQFLSTLKLIQESTSRTMYTDMYLETLIAHKDVCSVERSSSF